VIVPLTGFGVFVVDRLRLLELLQQPDRDGHSIRVPNDAPELANGRDRVQPPMLTVLPLVKSLAVAARRPSRCTALTDVGAAASQSDLFLVMPNGNRVRPQGVWPCHFYLLAGA